MRRLECIFYFIFQHFVFKVKRIVVRGLIIKSSFLSCSEYCDCILSEALVAKIYVSGLAKSSHYYELTDSSVSFVNREIREYINCFYFMLSFHSCPFAWEMSVDGRWNNYLSFPKVGADRQIVNVCRPTLSQNLDDLWQVINVVLTTIVLFISAR